MPDQDARQTGPKLGVERGEQFLLDEVEEAITAFIEAAPAHRQAGRGQVVYAAALGAEVLDAHQHGLRNLALTNQLRGGDGYFRQQRFAVEDDDDGIAAGGGSFGE